jgi:hypothetical protein
MFLFIQFLALAIGLYMLYILCSSRLLVNMVNLISMFSVIFYLLFYGLNMMVNCLYIKHRCKTAGHLSCRRDHHPSPLLAHDCQCMVQQVRHPSPLQARDRQCMVQQA